MKIGEHAAQLPRPVCGPRFALRSLLVQNLLQGFPLYVVHHQIKHPLRLQHVSHCRKPRMAQLLEELCLHDQTAFCALDFLHRPKTAAPHMPRQINGAAAAFSQHCQDPVSIFQYHAGRTGHKTTTFAG